MLAAPLGQAQVTQTLDSLMISKGQVVATSSGDVKLSEMARV